jgi:hypothetical protein
MRTDASHRIAWYRVGYFVLLLIVGMMGCELVAAQACPRCPFDDARQSSVRQPAVERRADVRIRGLRPAVRHAPLFAERASERTYPSRIGECTHKPRTGFGRFSEWARAPSGSGSPLSSGE